MFKKRRFNYFLMLSCTFFVYEISELQSQNLQETVEEATADTLVNGELKSAFRPVYGEIISLPFFTSIPLLYFITLPEEEVEITRRIDGGFTVIRKIGAQQAGAPTAMSFQEYADLHKKNAIEENW